MQFIKRFLAKWKNAKQYVASEQEEIKHQYDQLVNQYMLVLGQLNEVQVKYAELPQTFKNELEEQLENIRNKYWIQDQQLNQQFKTTIDALRQSTNDAIALEKIDEYLRYFSELNDFKVGKSTGNLAQTIKQSDLNVAPFVQVEQNQESNEDDQPLNEKELYYSEVQQKQDKNENTKEKSLYSEQSEQQVEKYEEEQQNQQHIQDQQEKIENSSDREGIQHQDKQQKSDQNEQIQDQSQEQHIQNEQQDNDDISGQNDESKQLEEQHSKSVQNQSHSDDKFSPSKESENKKEEIESPQDETQDSNTEN